MAGKLDFSEFHPLDHWPWERRCSELPKGKFRTPQGYHLHCAWEFKHKSNIKWYLHKWILCRLGWHDMHETWYPKNKQHRMVCLGCDKFEDLPWTGDPLEAWRNAHQSREER